MIGMLGGPELPDDDALRRMVLSDATENGGAETGIVLDELGPFDAASVVDGLWGVADPDGRYRQQRDEQQMVLGRGSGQLVLGRLRLAPEQFVDYLD